MDRPVATRSRGPGVTATILALLLVICLAESATEQRINSRGSKASLVERINGWRSQRGGSCLSYGHSCWGVQICRGGRGYRPGNAHGKRSGRPPIAAPDWYLTRMLRRIASNDVNHIRQLPAKNDDLSAIFQEDVPENAPAPATDRLLSENQDISMEVEPRAMEGKPMLDDEILSKIKLWQVMREASDN